MCKCHRCALGDNAVLPVSLPPKLVTVSVTSHSRSSLEPILPKEASLGFYPRAVLDPRPPVEEQTVSLPFSYLLPWGEAPSPVAAGTNYTSLKLRTFLAVLFWSPESGKGTPGYSQGVGGALCAGELQGTIRSAAPGGPHPP